MKEELIKKLQEIVKELTQEDVQLEISRSKDSSHGDFASNVALVLAKKLGRNPREVAEEIKQKFEESEIASSATRNDEKSYSSSEVEKSTNDNSRVASLPRTISKVEVAGPGFINFFLSPQYLIEKASKIEKGEFDFPNIGQDRAAVVEYSSPNIAKPFTIGHLRSTIIGDAIANLLQAVGYHVYRDNHLGDWGTQFGKQIYAIKNIPLKDYPEGSDVGEENEKVLDSSENPIKDLVNLYVKFHELAEQSPSTSSGQNMLEEEGRKWFKRLEDGDEEARRLWQKCIDWSFKEFDRIYTELGVKFTENGGRGYGEAFFEDKMGVVIEELKEKGLLKESKGAQLVFYPDDPSAGSGQAVLPPLMILKQDGATLYATRDLATDKFRLSHYGKDVLVINEVGAEQSLYWRQIYMLEEMLGWYKSGQRVHVGHGLFRFKEGKMSTRKGNVIWLEDVLEEAEKRAFNLVKQDAQFEGSEVISTSRKEGKAARENILGYAERINVSKQVAMGAIKWNDLKRSAHLDVTFDWDEVLNMQGNSGPYIQYSYVRTKSILEKAEKVNYELGIMNYDVNEEEMSILRQLDKFAEVVEQAAVTYSPNVVAQFLFELAQLFNNFYQKHRIVNASSEDERNFRLGLVAATGHILKKGLHLLGISAPERM